MEISFDEKSDETVMLMKYRFASGDPIEADVAHVLTPVMVQMVVSILSKHIERVRDRYLVEKSTPELIEKNPLNPSSQ